MVPPLRADLVGHSIVPSAFGRTPAPDRPQNPLMSTPSSAEAALEQIDRRNFAGARDLARQVIAQRPDDALALRALGVAEFALGRQKEALELLRRSVRADPSQALSHLALGNVLHEQDRLDAAIASYRRAQRLVNRQEVDPYTSQTYDHANLIALAIRLWRPHIALIVDLQICRSR